MARFNPNDTVLVTVDDGHVIPGTYQSGSDTVAIVKLARSNESVQEVKMSQLVRYAPLSDEAWDQWCRDEAPKIVEWIQQAMLSLFPNYKYHIAYEPQDPSIVMEGVNLFPKTVQKRTIVEVREFPAWELTAWKTYPSTMWQPEETVDHPVSEHRSSFDAANALVNFVLFDHVNRWFESEGEAIVLREDQENGL